MLMSCFVLYFLWVFPALDYRVITFTNPKCICRLALLLEWYRTIRLHRQRLSPNVSRPHFCFHTLTGWEAEIKHQKGDFLIWFPISQQARWQDWSEEEAALSFSGVCLWEGMWTTHTSSPSSTVSWDQHQVTGSAGAFKPRNTRNNHV